MAERGVLRRAGKAMTDQQAKEFLALSYVGRMATVGSDGYPYVIPLNIGYNPSTGDHGVVYFHSATEGHKLDNIAHNPRVCIQVDDGGHLLEGQTACEWAMRFRSVVAFGTSRVVTDDDERFTALTQILKAAGMCQPGSMKSDVLARTQVMAVDIEVITGKQSG